MGETSKWTTQREMTLIEDMDCSFKRLIEKGNKLAAERDRYKAERDDALGKVDLYFTWMDGRKQCPPYGIPVLGYLQRSMDMEYELDIVHFELTERWVVSTTGEDVDVLFWHLLPEHPDINKIKEG